MLTRLLRMVTIFALMLAPVLMVTGAPATARGRPAMAARHCDEMPQRPDSTAGHGVDCAVACAALPAEAPLFVAPCAHPSAATPPAPARRFAGRILETALPPPRLS